MILGIDPANEYSAFVVVENDLSAVVDKGKIPNKELQDKISNWKAENYPIDYVAIEGIQSFGMPVGQTTFETCYFIGRLLERFEAFDIEPTLIYRSEEKMLLCHSMKATDATIRQALIDLFAKDTPNKGKGTKKLDNRNQVKIKKISMIFHGFYCTLKIPEEKALFFRVV